METDAVAEGRKPVAAWLRWVGAAAAVHEGLHRDLLRELDSSMPIDGVNFHVLLLRSHQAWQVRLPWEMVRM